MPLTPELLAKIARTYTDRAEGYEEPDELLVLLVDEVRSVLAALEQVSMEHSSGRELGLAERVELLVSCYSELEERLEGDACIHCGCTDAEACEGGCTWVASEPMVCSSCAAWLAGLLAAPAPLVPVEVEGAVVAVEGLPSRRWVAFTEDGDVDAYVWARDHEEAVAEAARTGCSGDFTVELDEDDEDEDGAPERPRLTDEYGRLTPAGVEALGAAQDAAALQREGGER